MFLFLEETYLAPELTKPSYKLLLQGDSIQTKLQSIKIDKYETNDIIEEGSPVWLTCILPGTQLCNENKGSYIWLIL